MQTSDVNKEKYQLGDYELIQYQILQTYITRTTWYTADNKENYWWDLGSYRVDTSAMVALNLDNCSSVKLILEFAQHKWDNK